MTDQHHISMEANLGDLLPSDLTPILPITETIAHSLEPSAWLSFARKQEGIAPKWFGNLIPVPPAENCPAQGGPERLVQGAVESFPQTMEFPKKQWIYFQWTELPKEQGMMLPDTGSIQALEAG